MKIYLYISAILLLLTTEGFAQQFGISGELRPRFEARNGYKTLASPTNDPATFVSQRTRLNFDYKTEKFKIKFSIQNVRVWGDISTLAISDKNGTMLHEAWAEYYVSPNFSLKFGRQEISYDDQRIFGAVDWVQQARSHDALILKFKTGEKGKLDIGFALNANGETLFDEDYRVNQYKSLQYAWYHTNFNESIGISLLFLNNGLPYEQMDNQKTVYSQTLGGRINYKKGKIYADGATYFQFGSTPNTTNNNTVDLSAYYFTVNAKYNITNEFLVGAGIEYLSGNDQGNSSSKNKAFNPFYGTNHKFNGWMDYFYVGNHINNVGLIDFNIPLKYTKDKFSISFVPHLFSAEGDILNPNNTTAESFLGTEIDITGTYKLLKSVVLSVGYSQMFATESMEILKGGSKDETNNWAWAMITFKPNFFKKEFKSQN